MQYITRTELSTALGLHPLRMNTWPLELLPHAVMPARYRYADVNVWLAERAHNFAVPPTIERILSGSLRLVRLEQVVNRVREALGIAWPHAFLQRRISDGAVKAVCLRPRSWLIAADSVEQLTTATQSRLGFTKDELRLIFGFQRRGYRRKGYEEYECLYEMLEALDERYDRKVQYDRRSVVELVSKLLCKTTPPISPEDWIEDRLESAEPLLTVSAAAEKLGFPEFYVSRMATRGDLAAIRSPGGQRYFVSPEAVALYLENEQPLGNNKIAKVFGSQPSTVRHWRANGTLACSLHEQGCPLYRRCLVAYVATRAANGTSAVRWMHNALSKKGRKIFTDIDLLDMRLSVRQLRGAAQAGRVRSIVGPGRRPVYLEVDVMKERKRGV